MKTDANGATRRCCEDTRRVASKIALKYSLGQGMELLISSSLIMDVGITLDFGAVFF